MSESLNNKLKKIFPSMEKKSIFFIDGKVLVHRTTLTKIFNVTTQSIVVYEKKGLERWVDSPSRTPMYELVPSMNWYKDNITQKFRPNRDKSLVTTSKPIESSDLSQFLESLPAYKRDIFNFSELDTMDKLAKLRDIEKKEIDNSVKLGELIDRNDIDKREAGLVGMLMASQVNYEKAAPSELVGKDESEILSLIRSAHYGVTDELDRLFNKHFDAVDGFHDVMAVVLKVMSNGLSPLELIEKIEANE